MISFITIIINNSKIIFLFKNIQKIGLDYMNMIFNNFFLNYSIFLFLIITKFFIIINFYLF